MSQVNSRKRKGDHLDEHHQFNQHNRGYLSINMLNNSNLNHSIQTTNHTNNNDQNFNNTLTYLNNHQNNNVVNNLANQQSIYSNGQNLFKMDNHQLNQNHHIPNKLLIINSNTNSSSGSVVDESSRTEFSSIDNLSVCSDVVNLNNSNTTFTNNSQRKQRHETSLGQLTKKFVGLLQDKQGELNLNDASNILQVQKRRIYDITNVLEGVGLLSKTFKNKIKWVGAPLTGNLLSSNNSTTTTANTSNGQFKSSTITNANQQQACQTPLSLNNFNKILNQNNSFLNNRTEETRANLRKELDQLDAKEKEIDRKIRLAFNDMNQFTENDENKQYAFLTYLDVKQIEEFSNQTVIAIKAPSETKLELADPREKLQMFLKSDRGEIEVYICPSLEDHCANTNSCDFKSQSDDQGKGESITSEMDTQNKQNKNTDHLKYAFISEDDDLGPMGNRNLLMQTDDQSDQLLMHNKLSTPTSNYNTTPTSCSTASNLNISPASNSSITDIPFLHLQPPLSEDDYNFALEDSEGIVDLFDEMLPGC